MRNQGLVSLLAALLATNGHASDRSHSAVRHRGEDFQTAKSRFLGDAGDFPAGTAGGDSVPIHKLDQNVAVSWDALGSFDAVQHAFEQVRDVRFMHTIFKPKFQRRITWLYPDDGCFARAAAADLKYEELRYPMPSKVFAFGELEAKTENAPGGSVSWWYHVAPVISFGGAVFVLDPALEPRHPLPLVEWIGLMSSDPKSVTVAICAPGAYTPGSNCSKPDPNGNSVGPKEEQTYMWWEWIRVFAMGRHPKQELGDNPPWGH